MAMSGSRSGSHWSGRGRVALIAVLIALIGLAASAYAALARGSGPRRPAEPRDGQPARRSPGPLHTAALRKLLLTAALINAALSATEVALIAYARHHHALWASGPLLAGVSLGSILGSLVLGTQARTSSQDHDRPQNRLVRLLTGYACGLAVLTAAGLYPPLLVAAAPLAGLCLGPTLATLFGAAAAAAPPGRGTETQAWVNSIMNGGAAAGAAIAAFAAARPILALGLASGLAAVASLSAVHGPLRRGQSARTAARSGTRKTGPGRGGPSAEAGGPRRQEVRQ